MFQLIRQRMTSLDITVGHGHLFLIDFFGGFTLTLRMMTMAIALLTPIPDQVLSRVTFFPIYLIRWNTAGKISDIEDFQCCYWTVATSLNLILYLIVF